MARRSASGARDAAQEQPVKGFDARLERLEAIVVELESGELGLEAAIELYREGVALLQGCREELQSFRRQVEELSGLAEQALRPYDGDPDVEDAP